MIAQRLGAAAKRAGESLWYRRAAVPGLNLPVPVRLPYGGWFLAHPDGMGARIAGYRWARSGYEDRQWRFVARILAPGGTFVDVGANQGFYSLLGARCVGSQGRVLAFEPADSERAKLVRNLAVNRHANVLVDPRAVGRTCGTTQFHLCLDHQGSWSSIRRPADDVTARTMLVQVPIATLDRVVLEENGWIRVDLIKIDVEGGELDVLKGAEAVLAHCRPVILAELEERRTRQWGYGVREIIELLEAARYRWLSIDARGDLLAVDMRDARNWDNLVAVPVERHVGGSLA